VNPILEKEERFLAPLEMTVIAGVISNEEILIKLNPDSAVEKWARGKPGGAKTPEC
jgi:hypothetical protein